MSAAGALRYQVQAIWLPSGDSSARPSAGRARIASMKDRGRMGETGPLSVGARSGIGFSPMIRRSSEDVRRRRLEFEFLDDHRLVAGSGGPFLERRQRPHRVGVALRLLLELDAVCPEAAHHRRIHGIGDGGMAEQELALGAEALAAVAPQRGDGVDVGLRLGRHAAAGEGGAHVHRQVAAQGGKSGMHLGADRPRHRARLGLGRPQARLGETLGEIFADRQRLPDDELAVVQRRHPRRGRMPQDRGARGRLAQRHQHFLEARPALLQHQPGAQRPGGIILVGDIDGEVRHRLSSGRCSAVPMWRASGRRATVLIKGIDEIIIPLKLYTGDRPVLPHLVSEAGESVPITPPAEHMGPAELAGAAEDLAGRHSARFSAIVGDALLAENYPMIHAVGRASARAPRLADLTWGDAQAPKLTLVGKGVCFDSGGLDLKTAGGMRLMKKDMGGAATLLGLADAIMAARLPVRLRVLVPAVENFVSANAMRPLDVIRTRKGITVEIGNTDAEGRLILCDALSEADAEKPALLIDMATLTGAARTALGPELPALFSNDDALAAELLDAAEGAADPLWRMPLWKPYRKMLSSQVADINNVSESAFAGAITAALYLQEFVAKETPWAHIDTYAWNQSSRPGRPEGGEALGLRALYHLVEERFGATAG